MGLRLLCNQTRFYLQAYGQIALQFFLQATALGVLAYGALAQAAPHLGAQVFLWPLLCLISFAWVFAWLLRARGLVFSVSTTNALLFAMTLALCLDQSKRVGGSWAVGLLLCAMCFVFAAVLLVALYLSKVLAWARFAPMQVVVGITLIGTGLSVIKRQVDLTVSHGTVFTLAVAVCVLVMLWMQRKRPVWPHWLLLLGLALLTHLLVPLLTGFVNNVQTFPTLDLPPLEASNLQPWFMHADVELSWHTLHALNWGKLDIALLTGHVLFLTTVRVLDGALPLQTWLIQSGESIDTRRVFWTETLAFACMPMLGLLPPMMLVRNSMVLLQEKPKNLAPITWVGNAFMGGLMLLGLLGLYASGLTHIPLLLVVSVLIAVGFGFFWTLLPHAWLAQIFWQGFKRNSTKNIALKDVAPWQAWLIGLVFATAGTFWALGLGLALSVFAFIRDSERMALKGVRSLSTMRSRLWRSVSDYEQLAKCANAALIFELQGALNFAVAVRVRERVLWTLDASGDNATQFALLDVSRVNVLDDSGLECLHSLAKLLRKRGVNLYLCAPPANLQARMAGLDVPCFDTLDLALEQVEDELLEAFAKPSPAAALERARIFPHLEPEHSDILYRMGIELSLEAGKTLFEARMQDVSFYVVLQGRIQIGTTPQAPRFAALGQGRILGEMGFLDGQARSACAYAGTHECVLWRMTRKDFDVFAAAHPSAAAQVLMSLTRELADRLRVAHLKV